MIPRLKIYIIGPYSNPDPCINVARAMEAWHMIWEMEAAPFCPHLCHFLHIHRSRPYKEWTDYDMEWIDVCHAAFVLPGDSPGGQVEIKKFINDDKKVFYDQEPLRRYISIDLQRLLPP